MNPRHQSKTNPAPLIAGSALSLVLAVAAFFLPPTPAMAEVNPTVKKLMKWRNNLSAHRGAQFSMGKTDVLDKDPLKVSEVEQLLADSLRIFNQYSSLYRASSWSKKIIGYDDYQSLLKFIRLGLQKWDEDLAERLATMKGRQQNNDIDGDS